MDADHYAIHQKHSYVRQKVWEALGCLVSTKQFRIRLTEAAQPLSQLTNTHPHLVAELPEDVRRKMDCVVQALTKYQPEWKGGSVAEASVSRLTPRQRTKIAQEILEIYVAVSGGL
jgi:hypothetical protein